MFLLIRRSLGSTLFPYTTLFRSSALEWSTSEPGKPRARRSSESFPESSRTGPAGRRNFHLIAALEDRKSIRLNSSHMTISYAVFGLKKKNPTQVHAADVQPETAV